MNPYISDDFNNEWDQSTEAIKLNKKHTFKSYVNNLCFICIYTYLKAWIIQITYLNN